MSKIRSKSAACPNDVAKIARAELVKGIDAEIFSSVDISKVCDEYGDFICALLDKTPRPLASVISKGVMKGVSCTKAEADLFGRQIAAAVSYCRIKKRGFTTGVKLSVGTIKIIKKISHIDGDEPQPSKNTKKRRSPSPQAESPGFKRRRFRSKSSPSALSLASMSDDGGREEKAVSYDDLSDECQNIRKLYAKSSFLCLDSSNSMISSSNIKQDEKNEPMHTAPASAGQGDVNKKTSGHWVSPATMTLNRFDSSANVESAHLEPGPEGFCIARFEGEPAIATEVPNLVLEIYKKGPAILDEHEVKKRPAAAIFKRPAANQKGIKKKPAAMLPDDCTEEEEQDEEDEDEEATDAGGPGQPEAQDEPCPKEVGEKPSENVRKEMRTAAIDRRIELYQRWGCCKCRFTVCTPSCWKSRNMYEKFKAKIGKSS